MSLEGSLEAAKVEEAMAHRAEQRKRDAERRVKQDVAMSLLTSAIYRFDYLISETARLRAIIARCDAIYTTVDEMERRSADIRFTYEMAQANLEYFDEELAKLRDMTKLREDLTVAIETDEDSIYTWKASAEISFAWRYVKGGVATAAPGASEVVEATATEGGESNDG